MVLEEDGPNQGVEDPQYYKQGETTNTRSPTTESTAPIKSKGKDRSATARHPKAAEAPVTDRRGASQGLRNSPSWSGHDPEEVEGCSSTAEDSQD